MTIAIKAIGHVGICVADRDRSMRFYCDGLGFEVVHSTFIQGDTMSRLTGVDDVKMTMTILRRDGMSIELIHPESGHVPPPAAAPLNQLGFTHLALWVDDLDAAAAGIVEHGGTIVPSQRAEFDRPELTARFQMCADPDGVRIELVEYPAGQAAVLGDVR
ncbi:VOC family protein [Desertimonas flava]|jgi:lactoylglutathione lyase|uniref:VOC family protein n=1 Tax=Desertimonas flava TaxID=2064846 RepID=UPI000E34AFE6|nr:VOC family protein [Desertimonas flava]